MDHSMHTPLTSDEMTDDYLLDAVVYGPQDEKIGVVSHVHGMGSQTQVIIDVGGFLGIGSKPVAISARDLNFMRDEDDNVHAVTSWTKDDVMALPEHMH
jgi:hypothetical protein